MEFILARTRKAGHEVFMLRIDRGAAVRTAAAACCGAAVIIMLVGCNRSSQESQVSGSVTLDGSRIGPGMIVFAPLEGGKPATGSIDKNGSYTLNTSREPGLAAGKYKVAVSIRELPENVKRSDQIPPGKLLIPERYEQSTTSGLEYEVEPGRNTIDIDLTTA
jgi:hypothetical protein